MDNLMHSIHLLVTDPAFRTACGTDPRSALAQRGLALTEAELKAFNKVWALNADDVYDSPCWPEWWKECRLLSASVHP